ncbi:MAG: hypothetical protein ACTIC1_21135 [Brevibacterium sp.]
MRTADAERSLGASGIGWAVVAGIGSAADARPNPAIQLLRC